MEPLAEYHTATGRAQTAIEELRSVIQDATSGGYGIQELESTLLLAKITTASGERERLLNEIYHKATEKGLGRLAREAVSPAESIRVPQFRATAKLGDFLKGAC
jgi:hypothetical protein